MAYGIIEPTGTHIKEGWLKVRFDLYCGQGSKTYPLYYVEKPDRPYTEEELKDKALRDLVPTHKELNPIVCLFIKINPSTTRALMEQIVRETFDTNTVSQLDNILSKPNSLGAVNRLMKPKFGKGRIVPYSTDNQGLITAINARFTGLEVEVG